MKFVQFPNGCVWPVDNDSWIEGSILVPEYEDIDNLDARLEAISEAATGSICGLTDMAYQYHGQDLVSFRGLAAALPDDEADYEEAEFKVLQPDDDLLNTALVKQYGLSIAEARHAIASLGCEYGKESSLQVQGSRRQIRCPLHPESCSYVRIVVDGLEIAYWVYSQWGEDPAGTMGAFLDIAHGGTRI